MDKSQLLEIISRFNTLTSDDAELLFHEQAQYPYSQVLHMLTARVSRDLNQANQQECLHLAAIYTADRHVLKEMMLVPGNARVKEFVPAANPTEKEFDLTFQKNQKATPPAYEPQPENKEAKEISIAPHLIPTPSEQLSNEIKVTETTTVETSIVTSAESTDVIREAEATTEATQQEPIVIHQRTSNTPSIDEILANIEKLHVSMRLFEEVSFTPQERAEHEQEQTQADKSPKKKNDERDERVINLPTQAQAENGVEKKIKKKAGDKKAVGVEDSILNDIIEKDEIKIDNPAQRKQVEIIDQFMQQETVRPKKRATPQVPDETLSHILRKDIASETLVDILLEQGKYGKAIEVLKKLIWKYPHKKPYFADRIEKLIKTK